jgi:hypothetical protein
LLLDKSTSSSAVDTRKTCSGIVDSRFPAIFKIFKFTKYHPSKECQYYNKNMYCISIYITIVPEGSFLIRFCDRFNFVNFVRSKIGGNFDNLFTDKTSVSSDCKPLTEVGKCSIILLLSHIRNIVIQVLLPQHQLS